MDNNRLNYLSKVAEYGSISKAAEELYITSSALSKYIKKIEDDYDVKLFDRVGKKFELTYAGERYLHWLSSIEGLYDQMEDEMHDIANSYTGRLRVGVQLGGAYEIIDSVLKKFISGLPGILVEIEEATSSELRRMLEDNELDIALVPDSGLTDSIETKLIKEEQLVLVVPKGHKLGRSAEKRKGFAYPWIDISKYKDIPFVSPYPDQGTYQPFRMIEEECDYHFHIVARARTISRMLRCVRNDVGCTLSFDTNVLTSTYTDDVEMFSIGRAPHTSNLVIAYNKDHYLTHAAEVFIRLCTSSI